MDNSEEKLPLNILHRAVKSGREYGWRKDDVIQVIEAAGSVGLGTLGGQVQFVLPEGTCELNYLNYDSTDQQPGEAWADYVARSGQECIDGVQRILTEVDVIKEGVEHFDLLREKAAQGVNLEDFLVFILYFIEDSKKIPAYNYSRNEFVKVNAGFLIVKTFARLYHDYKDRYALQRDHYAMPRIDRAPMESPLHYRGLDRDALDDDANSEIEAETRLAMLAIDDRAVNGIIFSQRDVEEVFASLGPLQGEYEIIWSRIAGSPALPPEGYSSAGFEPTYFTGDHFSASCDCMLFPRWHGTDEAGELFMPYFRQLNQHGLFVTPEAARGFLDYYLSLDWTETGEYVIAEVWVR